MTWEEISQKIGLIDDYTVRTARSEVGIAILAVLNAIYEHNLADGGGVVSIGTKADYAVTDPASEASIISLLKGILSQLQGRERFGEPVVLAATDGYGGNTFELTGDGKYAYTEKIDLETEGYRGVVCTLKYSRLGVTDNMIVSAFGFLDAYPAGFATPILSIPCTVTENEEFNEVSFIVTGYPYVSIGVKTTGTTDTFDYRITYRPYR